MAMHSTSTDTFQPERTVVTPAMMAREGLLAGTIGAVTLAVWFLLLDLIQGRPLFTPTFLGTAFFKGVEGLSALENPLNTHDMVSMIVGFTFVHWLAFVLLGFIAARLLGAAERDPNLGFGVLLLFVVFEGGFLAVTTVFAAPVLEQITGFSIFCGNLLAAIAMGLYFWRRHRHMTIHP